MTAFSPKRRIAFALKRVSSRMALALVLVVMTTSSINAETISGPVGLRDGDTPVVAGVPVRLSGLTCDERGTRLGDAATSRLRTIIGRQHLTCRLSGQQTHDREVGRCFLPSGQDIAEVLIQEGLCGRCARYDRRGHYVAAERAAGRYAGRMPGYCR